MFDRIVVVDWSANATPKRGADSIWIGTVDAGIGAAEPVNVPTRRLARDLIVELCARAGPGAGRVRLPARLPRRVRRRCGFTGTPWAATWEHLAETITDDDRNRNNRWEVAAELNRRLGARWFWGVPKRSRRRLAHVDQADPPDRRGSRISGTPRLACATRALHPFSASQLLGAGSVGSQALTGIPVVHRLRHHPARHTALRVWPFETGLVEHPGADVADAVVLAEVWPSAIDFDHVDHPVKDARQVVALAAHLAALDAPTGTWPRCSHRRTALAQRLWWRARRAGCSAST